MVRLWSVVLLVGLCAISRGQTATGVATITTYAGPSDPVDGAQATAQFLDLPVNVRPDNAGGFYVVGGDKVYHISADGMLRRTAGTGVSGFSGDGGSARLAQLNQPRGLAVDGAGNLFIADTRNHRIRKVTPSGTITTVAGNGLDGFGGDGGAATSAALAPSDVAVDRTGNLFISDRNRIRKVNPDGIIVTVAGTGSPGLGGEGGPALSAQLSADSVAVDRMGNLFISDGNSRIRKVTPAGIITTAAGTGESGFSGDGGPATSAQLRQPFGIAVDWDGNLFIADFANHRVRKVTAAGIMTTVAGTGASGFSGDGRLAVDAQLGGPFDVAVTETGSLLIADGNGRIRMVAPTGVITTAAGVGTGSFGGDGGPAASPQTELLFPTSAALDRDGNLFITDATRVRKVSSGGTITTVAGSSDLSPAAAAFELGFPRGIVIDPLGNLMVTDGANHRILKVSFDGMITTIAGNGTAGFSGDGGPASSARLNFPSGIALDPAGNLFIADNGNHRIRKITVSGVISTVAGTGVSGFGGDGSSAVSALIQQPNGVAIDAAGNLFIADTGDNRIRKVNVEGIITTVAGDGTRGFGGDGGAATLARLNAPGGIAVDSAGNLFVADHSNHRIRKVTRAGIITTIAGNGSPGFSGDAGPAISAQLSWPVSVVLDSTGNNLYIVDLSKRVRKITFPAGSQTR